jgi:hypothetical protein
MATRIVRVAGSGPALFSAEISIERASAQL